MQAGDGRPSYDELAALVAEQARVIAELRARVAALEAENAELKRRLGMDSTNSSKPPSSDSPFTKPAPKSLRRKTLIVCAPCHDWIHANPVAHAA